MSERNHNTAYGLDSQTLEAVLGVFRSYPSVKKAILYGSRAKGNFRTGSDIDLSLEGDGLDLTTLQKIENDLDDLLLPYKIDLSLLKHISNQELLDHIKRVGKILFQKGD